MQKKSSAQVWQALFELFFAATLWGFGFIATRWALEEFSITETIFARFLVATVVGMPLIWHKRARQHLRQNLKQSFLPGLWLTSTLMFQTWGLKYTTATKSGFITTLYVIFVPLTEAFLSRRPMPRALWFCVCLAMLGTALIVDLGFSEVNQGDVLTLVCAFLATLQIYWLGLVSPGVKEPFAFNIFQSMWGMLLCLPFVSLGVVTQKFITLSQWPPHAWFGLLSLSLGSTVIAFYCQIRAQRWLPPTVSSLIFLLESPFAWIFAMIFLGESFRGMEGVGAGLIFTSAVLATWIEARRKKA